MMSSEKTNNSRRDFLVKSMALIPTVVIGGAGAGAIGVATSATAQAAPASEPASGNTAAASDWKPQFFNDREWAFINAAVARLIPADELGPGAKEAGVPEFIDRQLNTPYATGSIWYMQGPFNPDVPKEMGYQLPLVPKQIYNLGIADAEAWCQDKYHKTVFCKNGDITNPELSGGKMPDAGRNMTWDLRAPAPTPSHLRATVAIKGSFRGAEF